MKKNKICWVTSLNKKYYNYVGKISLPTWKFLEGDKFFLYEGNILEIPNYAERIDIEQSLKDFKPLMQKEIEFKSKKAFKFFKKAFSIWYALEKFSSKYDYVVWLDTDAIVQKPINLKNLLPGEDQLFSTIIRGIHGCDSGFVAFNTNHKNFISFPSEYIEYYTEGKIWKMHNPWDAYILEDFSKKENIKNLYTGKQDNASCGFQDTLLWEYVNHYWGKRGKLNLGKLTNEI
jgi:hypothetical protein